MRAVVWDGAAKDMRVRDDVVGMSPGPREVKVRVHNAGFCHSDLSVMNGTIAIPITVVMGHEGAGIVEEVGSAVTKLKPGDHVVTTTLTYCGQCDACARGQLTNCKVSTGTMAPRYTIDGKPVPAFANAGVFSEHAVVHEHQAIAIDKRVPLAAACLIGCAIVTGAGAVFNRAKVQRGQSVVVIGAGGIGQAVIQAARICGASRIVVVDANPAKEETARRFGATDFLLASPGADTVAAVRDLGLPSGADHTFECVGHPALIRQAIDLLDWGGTCTLLGVPGREAEASFNVSSMYNNKSILGCRYGDTRPHHDIPLIVSYYLDGRFQLDEMVSKVYPLEDINSAIHDLEAGKLNRGVLALA